MSAQHPTRRLLLAVAGAALALPAAADDLTHAQGHFALWLPPAWPPKLDGARLTAENPQGNVDVLAGPLDDPDADLTDEDVLDFIDDELDTMKVETDTPLKHRGLNARRIAGTGTDEGDVVRFHALAVDPGGKAAIIMVLVYGAPGAFEKGRASELTEHILNSFHPV